MGLILARVVRILHDDWSIRLGENRPDRVLKHLAAILQKLAKSLGLNPSSLLAPYPGIDK